MGSACEKSVQWLVAVDLLHTMRVSRIETDTISCSAAISACENKSNDVAVHLYIQAIAHCFYEKVWRYPKLDLHGMSLPVARTAVRWLFTRTDVDTSHVIIVVGRGRHSYGG